MFDLQTLDEGKLSNALANARQKLGNTGPGKMLLYKAGLGANGWLLGQEAMCVSEHEVLVLTASFRKGYVAFNSVNKKLGEVSAPVFSNNIASPDELSSLPDAQVQAQTSVTVYLPKLDTQAEMKGSTIGMEQAMDGLLNEAVERMDRGELVYCNPRVQLGNSSYKHPGGANSKGERIPARMINIPLLTVIAWCDAEGNAAPSLSIESRI